MSAARSSPVTAGVRVEAVGETVTTRMVIRPEETVFAGHYPGFPIFPGVCVVECAHLSALAAPPADAQPLTLAAVESTRFLSPVFPGDDLVLELSWKQRAEGWQCSVAASTERGRAAQIRLLMTERETR